MDFLIVLGTRPEIIKLSPIIRDLAHRPNTDYGVVHTNQHYDRCLDAIFFEELALQPPAFNLGVGTAPHGRQTGLMLERIEKVLMDRRPAAVIVQGDTNSTFAGALAAAKLHIPVAHVEAGLRSYDRRMPEEINRIMVDHIADFLYPPTQAAADLLAQEGITKNVTVVGNTVVDALYQHLRLLAPPCEPAVPQPEKQLLVTIHRDSNTDAPNRLRSLLESLAKITLSTGMTALFPAHPRTIERARRFGLLGLLHDNPAVRVVEPMGYLEFLSALKSAAVVVTDSGGVQEEACVLGVPCVTVRTTTERPETVDVGANILTPEPYDIPEAVLQALALGRGGWPHPYGDGESGVAIVESLVSALG